ncbi:hypothetical protein QT381_12435 [Galbitalea sp. SE-J8]|uniref:hypothetical protein n=1 Tax=Galbitalea sp. SE-J8 TaxID=3054952 RepID=UPI00259D1E46|nr:hypothetical protein [Galbitalea sp. SE-J8]MDM4763815.1 hypothetical protein [Galbitalea sp. SE-J8]
MALTQHQLDAEWDFDDAAASERRLRDRAGELLNTAAEAQEWRTQVARALGLQGRIREADAVLDDVHEWLGEFGAAPEVAARLELERGRLRTSGGDTAEAQELFLAAIDAAREADLRFLLVDALHMLAIADAAHAREWTRVALLELDADSDARTRRWEVSLRNNLGWALVDAGDPRAALPEFEAAVESARLFGTPQQVAQAEQALAECRGLIGSPND